MEDEIGGGVGASPVVRVEDERLVGRGVSLWLKRDDLLHPAIPGNKWRKLVPNLRAARERGPRRLVTFGGAWSNHIAATAAAGRLFGFETVGVIRGEEHLPLNPVLAQAVADGMRLVYMDRSTYRRKHTPDVIEQLSDELGDFYLVPEGGSNELAVRSCRDIPSEIDLELDLICCAVGTGGTLAGIAAGLQADQRALGFSALRGGGFLVDEVERLQVATFGERLGRWDIECGYHFGGFAKRTAGLDAFIADFTDRHGVALERVYVAKMLFGVLDLVQHGAFPDGTRIVAVVTG
jgi:1-aminocyclopropane-1-carboxylate deaminase